jgi:lysophospholipase L1-like esterase
MNLGSKEEEPMTHVALVGDSVFDNLVYVQPGIDVQQQLREALPSFWKVTLCAIDGSITNDVLEQLEELPEGVSHIVVSVGGNDGLQNMPILSEKVSTVAEGLSLLSEVVTEFRSAYREMLEELAATKIPATVCTIYQPRFDQPVLQRVALMALSLFNDVIVSEAIRMSIPVLDLRQIFTELGDYANPIEPSVQGGGKMAAAIAQIIVGNPANLKISRIYGSP